MKPRRHMLTSLTLSMVLASAATLLAYLIHVFVNVSVLGVYRNPEPPPILYAAAWLVLTTTLFTVIYRLGRPATRHEPRPAAG
ncbi:MAG: hypothetical protein QXV14_06375 [Candidatus Caldarchaeum sp.]